MLEKKSKVDLIEVVENGAVQVRIKTIIYENNIEINSSFSRYIISPGDDYSNEDERVKLICKAVQTVDVVENFKTITNANKLKVNG